jgi:hypothetical protein
MISLFREPRLQPLSQVSHRCVGLAILAALQGVGCHGEDATIFPSGVAAPDSAPPSEPGEAPSEAEPTRAEHVYVTSTVVFSNEGQNTYLSLLPSLDARSVDLQQAREFPGWSSVWAHEGKLFISDGEAPTITRFAVSEGGAFSNEGTLSFLNQGAQFAESAFVTPDKAYVFADQAVVWSSRSLAITGSFDLPATPDRPGGMQYGGLSAGRSLVVRGDRTYVATSWANWDEYAVSEDSLIVVLDTDTDRVVDTLAAPCPYLDVATLDDDGSIYFSNWVYSLWPTLLSGKKSACAVRIPAGEDRIDPDWSLTFADVTGGHEAAALRYVGGRKALISVYHDERADLSADGDPAALADAANWRFWMLDLDTRAASPIDAIGYHAGGFSTSRIDGRTFLMVPSADYESTSVYELALDDAAELRWSVPGWATELYQLR